MKLLGQSVNYGQSKSGIHMDNHNWFTARYGRLSDEELIDAVYDKIVSHYNNWINASILDPLERVVVLVTHISGIVDNGGFEFLFSGSFEGDPGFKHSVEAHKIAGLDCGYEAFREALDTFSGDVPSDPAECIRQYELNSEGMRIKVNSKYWDEGLEGVREKKLAEYIRKNSAGFSELYSMTH